MPWLYANTAPFHMRDLSICGLWYLLGVLELLPTRTPRDNCTCWELSLKLHPLNCYFSKQISWSQSVSRHTLQFWKWVRGVKSLSRRVGSWRSGQPAVTPEPAHPPPSLASCVPWGRLHTSWEASPYPLSGADIIALIIALLTQDTCTFKVGVLSSLHARHPEPSGVLRERPWEKQLQD